MRDLKWFDSLSKRDFDNGAVINEIREVFKATGNNEAVELLKEFVKDYEQGDYENELYPIYDKIKKFLSRPAERTEKKEICSACDCYNKLNKTNITEFNYCPRCGRKLHTP